MIVDLLQEVLELVVPPGPPVVDAAVDQVVAEGLHPLHQRKPALQLLDRLLPLDEAPHALPVTAVHHLHQRDDALPVLQDRREALVEQPPELEELLGVESPDHLDVLRDQLEGTLLLQLHALPRRVGEEEAEVDVDDVPLPVDEDVAVVAVLHLQEVGQDRVARQAAHEVLAREVRQREGPAEELPEGESLGADLLEEAVEGGDVVEHLDDPVVGAEGDDLVGEDHALQLLLPEDVLEAVDQLHRELLLLDVVPRLHHQVHHPPALQLPVDRLTLRLLYEDLRVLPEEVVQVVLGVGLVVDGGVDAGAEPLALGLVLVPLLVDLGDAVLLVGEGGEGLLGTLVLLGLLVGGEGLIDDGQLLSDVLPEVEGVALAGNAEGLADRLVDLLQDVLLLLLLLRTRLLLLLLLHLRQVQLLSLTVDLQPDRVGRPLLRCEQPPLPHRQYREQPDLVLEEGDVHVGGQFLVHLLQGFGELFVAFGQGRLGDAVADLDQVFPELGSLHEAVLAVLLAEDVLDGGGVGREGRGVVLGGVLGDVGSLDGPPLFQPLLLELLHLVAHLPLGLELGVHLDHALGELDAREAALRVHLHPCQEGVVEKLPDVADPVVEVVLGERVEVEVDAVGEVEVSGAPLDDEGDELLVSQVLLDDHVGDDLRDEVLEVVALLAPVDHGVDALGRQQRVDPGGRPLVLVEVVEDLVDGLLVAVLDVLELLRGDRGTMLEDFSRLTMGIFQKVCSFFSPSAGQIYSDQIGPPLRCRNRCNRRLGPLRSATLTIIIPHLLRRPQSPIQKGEGRGGGGSFIQIYQSYQHVGRGIDGPAGPRARRLPHPHALLRDPRQVQGDDHPQQGERGLLHGQHRQPRGLRLVQVARPGLPLREGRLRGRGAGRVPRGEGIRVQRSEDRTDPRPPDHPLVRRGGTRKQGQGTGRQTPPERTLPRSQNLTPQWQLLPQPRIHDRSLQLPQGRCRPLLHDPRVQEHRDRHLRVLPRRRGTQVRGWQDPKGVIVIQPILQCTSEHISITRGQCREVRASLDWGQMVIDLKSEDIYQMKLSLALIGLLLLLGQVQSIARAPTPYCTSQPIIKQLPITSDEIILQDTADLFQGYNLKVTLGSNNSWADMTSKWLMLDQRNQYFPNIISHYIEPKDNGVGRDSFLLYKDLTGSTLISYGIIRDKGSLPEVNSTAIVTTDKDVTCFDAALFLDHGLAVIDCVKKSGSLFSSYRNYFYIIDLTNHSLKKVIENDLYVNYNTITRRRLMKFSHPEAGGFTYLLRSHFADGVDQAHSDNTYMEIFIVPVEDPTEIEPLRVIDRTFLNLKALRIMDAEIYLDDIFLLDYDTGLFRLDILQSQRVAITGRYRDFGFTKFAVYSDDLQDELIIALSNKHSVYEIDWHVLTKPVLINKYSLMESSNVKQIFMNDRYLVVQSSADAYNATNPKFEVDYTWIFTKGSRTYLNAYHVINHNSSIVEVDFDRENSRLYIADEKGLTLRQIDQARLVLHYMNESFYGKTEDVVLFADSFDFNSNETFRCQEKFTAIFISKDNFTIFPTGIDPTDVYSINFPNPLEIPLNPYYFGPDIEYSVLNHKGDNLPTAWVNKLNKTSVTITPVPTLDTVFFHTDVVNELGHDLVIYYYQDTANNTHVAECTHLWANNKMSCQVVRSFNHTSRIRTFTSSYFRSEEGWSYFYSVVFEGQNKIVHIYDFMRHMQIAEITNTGDYEAEITQIASSNGFLYVLRRLAKSIDVYSLAKCEEYSTCAPDFTITHSTLKGLGVRYFSPEGIVTDDEHPEVIFIKCLGSLLILDIDNKERIHLLDEIVSPATGVRNFQVALSRKRMLIAAYPNYLVEYSLERLYTYNMVTLVKTLSTYGHNIQPNADIEYSDFDGTAYVNAVDPVKNVSVVLIYHVGVAATHSLYTTVTLDKLYSRPGFEIEVSGRFCNFMTIITGSQYQVFRVFTEPFITINETTDDFSFKIQAFNKQSTQLSNEVNVTVVNQKQFIVPTKVFNETNGNLTAGDAGNYEWEDREWFTGNIVHYNYTCDDCHKGPDSKVRIREHIDNFVDLHVGGNYYTETPFGGLSVWGDLFRFRPNGSVYEISNLPDQKQMETCNRVAAADNEIFAVTACQELGRGINLYVTSFACFKSFTWGPYYSDAYNVRSMMIINDVLMLADTPAYPEYLFEEGAVYLYRLSFNAESGDEMDELEVIDSNDFLGVSGWNDDKAYLGNAHMVYSGNTNAYRLYITEARYGFFVVDFVKAHASDAEITILTTSFINVKKLLEDNNLHLPTDASFQAISFVKATYNPHFDVENVVITTKGYHSFEITIVYDDAGHVQAPILHRVYQRYSFYNAFNEVHAKDGFIVLGYVLPPNIDATIGYRKQYVALYDSIDYPHESDKGYSEHFLIGAIPINTTNVVSFAINSTYDFHSNGTRSGIVIGQPFTHQLYGASIAHNLTLSLTKGYKSQDILIKAYNDFSAFNFNATVQARPDDDSSDSVIIIIIIVLCAIVFVFFLFYIFSIARKKQPVVEERESLITENEEVARQSVAQNGAYQPPASSEHAEVMHRQNSESDSEEEQEQEEQEEQVVPVPKAQVLTSAETASVDPQPAVQVVREQAVEAAVQSQKKEGEV